MGLLDDLKGGYSLLGTEQPKQVTIMGLAGNASAKEIEKQILAWKEKSLSLTRADIKKWKTAKTQTTADDPKNFALQLIYENDILPDSLLKSQIRNRKLKVHTVPFQLVKENGDVDQEQTTLLEQSSGFRKIISEIQNAHYRGYSLIEQKVVMDATGKPKLVVKSIPRTNVVPQRGLFFPDYTEDTSIEYRNLKEFGSYILEFVADDEPFGLLDGAVPYALFKKFGFSCWSELCEIFGIPPRYMKTDTANTKMLNRAETMMKDIGAAAWFIIDQNEEFEFANATNTDGSIYEKLKNACNNEMSMLISGAIIAQDTVNGNRSKDESAQAVLDDIVKADRLEIAAIMNEVVLPALVNIGFIKPGSRFEYSEPEDLATLWTRTKDSFAEFDVDPEWIKETFKIEIVGKKTQPKQKLSYDPDFFD